MEKGTLKIFETDKELVEGLVEDLIEYFEEQLQEVTSVSVALSGGNTPKKIYKYISDNYKGLPIWDRIKFFWGDERCVPPDDPESNYGSAKELLFDNLKAENLKVFRIRGEENPENEAEKYASLILNEVEIESSLPRFDLIILGIGEDGHTASIFQPDVELFSTDKICAATKHPVSGQDRITLTGNVINNSANIIVLASGLSKKNILKEILETGERKYPAARIEAINGSLIWYADEDAAAGLKDE